MASPRLLASLLLVTAACGDDGTTSASGTEGAGTTTTSSTGGSATAPTAGSAGTGEPTTTAGSHSASDSETGDPTTAATLTGTASTTATTTTATSTTADSSTTGTTTEAVSDAGTESTAGTESSTGTESTTGPCVDLCQEDATQCVGADAVQTCGIGEGGCLDWADPVPCAAQEVCQAGACVPGCADACDLGVKQCTGGGVATCVDDPMSGCTVWADPVACPQGHVCESGACVVPIDFCVDDCEFTLQPVAATVDFYDVWGSDAKHVWVVGASGTALYYNGVTWKSVDTGIGKRLDCVDGSAADDVYAIARDGQIIRWDGLEWLPHVDLNPIWEAEACLSVLGTGDLLALVHDDNGNRIVLYRVTDGVKTTLGVYEPQYVFTPNGSKSATVRVRALAPDLALISADRAFRWDGMEIANIAAPNPSFGMWALAPDFAYAAAPHSGIGHRWNGNGWMIVNPGLSGYLHMFTGTSKTRVFGVGETAGFAAAIVVFDGIGWSTAATPPTAKALFAGWSAATGEIYAVGKSGTILIGK